MPREREYLCVLDNGHVDRARFSDLVEMHDLFMRDGFGSDSEYSEEFDYWTVLVRPNVTRTYSRANPRRRPPVTIEEAMR